MTKAHGDGRTMKDDNNNENDKLWAPKTRAPNINGNSFKTEQKKMSTTKKATATKVRHVRAQKLWRG